LKDIAQDSGVSIATVSRFLNGVKVTDDAARSIDRVLQKKGFSRVNNAKTELCTTSSPSVVGMIVPDIRHNYISTIVAGAMESARKNNQVLLLASSDSSGVVEREHLKTFSRIHLDGLIYIPVASWAGSFPDEIALFDDIPVVVAARRNVLKDRPHVYVDNITAGYLATKYLLNLGHRKIAFIAGTWENPFNLYNMRELVQDESKIGGFASLDRFKGYLQALDEFSIPYEPALATICPWSFEGGKNAIADLIGKVPVIDGVVTTSDTMASGVVDTLKSHGFSIPNNISVMGWDNSELARFTDPQLTSVEQPSQKMGMSASDLIYRMRRHEVVENIVYSVNIVPRGSTALKK
jgi:LacI family transcriptional regulator